QTAKLTATFSPQIPEPYNYTGVVTIASNSSTNPSAVINMNGAGIAASTLKTLSCGTASYTGAGTDACTVTLSGAVPSGGLAIALSSNNSAVTVPSSVTVAAGATSAAFSSSVTAVTTSQTATITATASGLSQTFAIQLGTAGGSLSINATSVPFGEIIANSTATQTITLTATGTSPVTVRGASIAGSGFSVSGTTFPVTLNPGQTANLSVVFAPLTAGSYTGQLTISSNCTGGSTGVSLSGTGDPHRVQLSWNTPSAGTDPVVGYNIYRATAGSSNYQLINSAEDSQTTYSDTTVVHATSYVYYVMSVDSLGAQSVASNTTTVTIP
ncbi:MAG: choice-of-anchor D domain-containing protein, partial [Terracidiphilus sp.]